MTLIEEQALLIRANSIKAERMTIAQIGSRILEILYSSEGRRKALMDAAAELIHQAEMEGR